MISTTSLAGRISAWKSACVLLALCQAGVVAAGNGSIEILEESRVALVIGNGAYAERPLASATNDALAMTRALKASGFQVIQRLDADKRGMTDAIGNLRQRIRRGGAGLFYYAGYAMQVAGRNYLVPIGSDIDNDSATAFEAVDLGALVSAMGKAGNRINIVILEAGRPYPGARKLSSSATGLARVESSDGVFVAFSSTGTVLNVAAPAAGNSLYTKMLLKSMAIPGRTLPEVFRTARVLVTNTTTGQVPWFSSSSSEDFMFLFEEREPEADNPLLAMTAEEEAKSRKWLWLLLGLGVAGSIAIASSDGDQVPSTGGVEIEVVVP